MPDAATLASIRLQDLHDNPNQPRIALNEETIAAFAVAIERAAGFPKDAAIVVRPREPHGYEIIAGHHRIAAARAAGLTHAWAFVRQLDDRAAMIELVTSNNHTSMTPLEHGRAAIALKNQGIHYYEYGRMVGKSTKQITSYVAAYSMLQEYGGPTGPYSHIYPLVLEEAGRIKDKGRRDGVMYVLKRDEITQTHALEAIKLVKQGEPVTASFKAAKAMIVRRWAAAKQAAQLDPEAAPGNFANSHVETGALSAWAAAGFTNDTLTGVMSLARFQAAALAEYAARFGPLPDDGSVQRRMEALRLEELADESPADERRPA